MATVNTGKNTEQFCRLVMLTAKCGTEVLRDLVLREVNLQNGNNNVDVFLLNLFTQERKHNLPEYRKNILFPPSGDSTDIKTWDFGLLAFVLLDVCTGLDNEIIRSVRQMRDIRNRVCHPPGNAFIDDEEAGTFFKDIEELKMCIKGCSIILAKDYDKLVYDVEHDALISKEEARRIMREWREMETPTKDHLERLQNQTRLQEKDYQLEQDSPVEITELDIGQPEERLLSENLQRIDEQFWDDPYEIIDQPAQEEVARFLTSGRTRRLLDLSDQCDTGPSRVQVTHQEQPEVEPTSQQGQGTPGKRPTSSTDEEMSVKRHKMSTDGTSSSLESSVKHPTPDELNEAIKQHHIDSPEVKDLCDQICCKIKESSSDIKHVWPGYKVTGENQSDSITFVAVTENGNPKNKNTFGFDVLFRKENTCNREGQIVMNREKMKKKPFTKTELKELKQCLSKVSPTLMKDHSNIEIVTACSMKSKNYKENTHDPDLSKETCIVLYVHVKGIVPLHEDVFPKQIGEFKFPVDVREGCFMLCGGPHEYHDYLKMGCAIGRAPPPMKLGTLGAFYEKGRDTFCLTSSHVLLTGEEIKAVKDSPGGQKTFNPESSSSLGVHQPVRQQPEENDRFGELDQAYFDAGGEHGSGMEIAVVKIQRRDPVSGDFPDGNFEHAGFIEPMVYNSGQVLDPSKFSNRQHKMSSELVKYGCATGLTRGVFALDGPSVRKIKVSDNVDDFDITLHDQIEVHNTGQTPFAEKGDSGALVFSFFHSKKAHPRPIGIITGVYSNGSTIITPISVILKKLGVSQLKCFNPETAHRLWDAKMDIMRKQMNESMNTLESIKTTASNMANKAEMHAMEERLVREIKMNN